MKSQRREVSEVEIEGDVKWSRRGGMEVSEGGLKKRWGRCQRWFVGEFSEVGGLRCVGRKKLM